MHPLTYIITQSLTCPLSHSPVLFLNHSHVPSHTYFTADTAIRTTVHATKSRTDKTAIHATDNPTDLGREKKGKFCFICTDSVCLLVLEM